MKNLGKKGKLFFYFVLSLVVILSIFLITTIIKTKMTTIETSENDFNSELQDETISDEIQEETTDIAENTNNIDEVENQETEEIKLQETVQATETNSKKSSTETKAVAQNTKEQTKVQSKSASSSSKSSSSTTTAAQTGSSSTSTTTTTSASATQDTVKRFTQAEINAEKSKYLSDIKSIAPGLNYVYSKRGQVFWPYRTSEISVFTRNLSFGTIYYYVDTFVESGQEKFKYYIDWAS